MIIKQTVNEINKMLNNELARLEILRKAKDTNANKNITKINNLKKLLANFDDSVVIEVENCRGDEIIRNFALVNIGSVVECLVKLCYTKANEMSKTWCGIDYKHTEIKASLSANSLSTPATDKSTLLVNMLGVYRINKADVQMYTNKQGRLPHNKPCGKRVEWLSKMLGYDGVEA